MGYEPTINRPTPLYPLDETARPTPTRTRRAVARDTAQPVQLANRRPLRFGGLTLDVLTGVVQWRGRTLPLSEDEVEVLQVFMQNAGRILSGEQIAKHLGERLETAEARIRGLHGSLRLAGAKCLPRHTTGLGYILWH